MWTTSDGHELTLPQSRLAPITSQLRRPELKELVRRNYQGNLKAAVVRSVGQLARSAHRTGNLRHRKSNRRYPVFTVGLNGREYEIITSPIGSEQNAIISVNAGSSFELQEVTAPQCPYGWKIYPPPDGICVPTHAQFQPAGSVGEPNAQVTADLGVYIIKFPDIPNSIRRLDLGNKKFYFGSATYKPREPTARNPGGFISRIIEHENNLNRYGINPNLYRLYVWKIPDKSQALATETEVLRVNGAPQGTTHREPWTIITNEIEIEEGTEKGTELFLLRSSS